MKFPSDHDHPTTAEDHDTVVIDVRGDEVRDQIRSIERSGVDASAITAGPVETVSTQDIEQAGQEQVGEAAATAAGGLVGGFVLGGFAGLAIAIATGAAMLPAVMVTALVGAALGFCVGLYARLTMTHDIDAAAAADHARVTVSVDELDHADITARRDR